VILQSLSTLFLLVAHHRVWPALLESVSKTLYALSGFFKLCLGDQVFLLAKLLNLGDDVVFANRAYKQLLKVTAWVVS
jgi:hypothetical protein